MRKPFANRLAQIAITGKRSSKDAFPTQFPQHSSKFVCHLSYIVATNGGARQDPNTLARSLQRPSATASTQFLGEMPPFFTRLRACYRWIYPLPGCLSTYR